MMDGHATGSGEPSRGIAWDGGFPALKRTWTWIIHHEKMDLPLNSHPNCCRTSLWFPFGECHDMLSMARTGVSSGNFVWFCQDAPEGSMWAMLLDGWLILLGFRAKTGWNSMS